MGKDYYQKLKHVEYISVDFSPPEYEDVLQESMIHDIFLTTDVKYLSKNPHMGVRLRPPLSSINKKLYLLSSYCSISIATLR